MVHHLVENSVRQWAAQKADSTVHSRVDVMDLTTAARWAGRWVDMWAALTVVQSVDWLVEK